MAAESVAQDTRKRTLEALERRLAVAKAELLTQQKKGKKSIDEDGKQHHTASYTSTDSSLHSCVPSDTPPLSTFSKRGNSAFNLYVFVFSSLHSQVLFFYFFIWKHFECIIEACFLTM